MITIEYEGQTFEAKDDESVLSCLTRCGVAIANSCQAGVCQSCAVRVVQGVPHARAQAGLTRAQREARVVLACQQPAAAGAKLAAADARPEVPARVEGVEWPTKEIAVLRIRPDKPLDYAAGQFFHVLREDGAFRSYSAASLPSDPTVELHVRVIPGGTLSPWLTAQNGQTIALRGPFGGCTYLTDAAERDAPLIFAGVGTGAAPLLAVLKEALLREHRGPLFFVHGARNLDGLYLREGLAGLAASHRSLTVMLSALERADGVSEQPVDVIVKERVKACLSGGPKPLLYLCGDAPLVAKLKRDAYLAGLNLDRIFADPFLPSQTIPPAAPS